MPTLLIPTHDRPETLAQCLGSLSPQSTADIDRLVILDDSSEKSSVVSNSKSAEFTQERLGIPVKHLQPDSKAVVESRVLDRLPSEVPKDLIRWAVRGGPLRDLAPGAGPNRNVALLLTAGSSFLSIDDDALCRFSTLVADGTSVESSPIFVPEPAFQETLFSGTIDTRQYLERLRSPSSGSEVATMIRQIGQSRTLPNGTVSKVRLGMSGISGNRWYDRPTLAFYAKSPLREQLYRSRKTYVKAGTSGLAVLQARRPTVTDAGFWVSCFSAIANDDLMPPFPPIGRAEDTVFSSITRKCFSNTLVYHLPAAIHHDLGPSRPVLKKDLLGIRVNFSYLTVAIVNSRKSKFPVEQGQPAMQSLGEQLCVDAGLPDEDWADYVRNVWVQHLGALITDMENLLERYESTPRYWANDVEKHILELKSSAVKSNNIIPTELFQVFSDRDAMTHYRQFIMDYGRLLKWWPSIWESAKTSNLEDGWLLD